MKKLRAQHHHHWQNWCAPRECQSSSPGAQALAGSRSAGTAMGKNHCYDSCSALSLRNEFKLPKPLFFLAPAVPAVLAHQRAWLPPAAQPATKSANWVSRRMITCPVWVYETMLVPSMPLVALLETTPTRSRRVRTPTDAGAVPGTGCLSWSGQFTDDPPSPSPLVLVPSS